MNREAEPTYKYQSVEQYLRERIQMGAYGHGQPIESEGALCEQFSLTRATVRHALAHLQRQGLIERGQGRRSYAVTPDQVYQGRRHGRVALVTYDPGYFDMQALREQALCVLERAGFEVVVRYITEEVITERRALKELIEQPLDGLIIEGVGTAMPSFNMDLYERIERMRLPIVFTNGYHRDVRAAHVVADDRQVMRAMVDHLSQLGHRDIGGIFGHGQYQGAMRFQGYLDGLHNNGLEFDDQRVLFLSYNDRRFIFDNLFNAYRDSLLRCTAFVCYSDSYAEFLEATLRRNGVSVPGDVSITGMDNLPESRMGERKFTTATLPLSEMGRRAAEMLVRMIETCSGTDDAVLACEFVQGNSTRAPA